MTELEIAILRRLGLGQKFTCFESADGSDWQIGIGPVSDFLGFARADSVEIAQVVTGAMSLSFSDEGIAAAKIRQGRGQ